MKTTEFLKIEKRDYLATSYTDYRENRKHRYLCTAIQHAADNVEGFSISFLLNRITKALKGSGTVDGWLLEQGHASVSAVRSGNAMYEYRHRWIDSLIEEYETKGD